MTVGMTVLLGIGAVVFGSLETQTRTRNYDAYLLAAGNSTTKEEEIQNYRQAISLNPSRADAYLLLLENGYLDDNFLETRESEELRKILIDYGNGQVTNERSFRENTEGYEQFAYEAGIAYFYKFEEKSNKKNAKGYFEIAAGSDTLEAHQVERAKRLYVVSDYYSRIGIVDEAGDASVTYRQYWDDLTSLSEGNLVEMDNERTALVMYEELAGQMISRTMEFKNDGVEQEEMLLQLENIKEHLKTDFSGLNAANQALITEELKNLEHTLKQAEKMIPGKYCTLFGKVKRNEMIKGKDFLLRVNNE